MGLLKRLFGRESHHPQREAAIEQLYDGGLDDEQLTEIEIVGESQYQDSLARVAGAKEPDGKQLSVGVTLRSEPSNPHDDNAVRVEVMGLVVGYVRRDQASVLSALMQRSSGGVLEGRGMIVGGWRDDSSEGSYGIRVCITTSDAARIGLDSSQIAPVVLERNLQRLPTFPVSATEHRLTPTGDTLPTSVTVTEDDRYQDVISSCRPEPWDRNWWPTLVVLDLSPNPHAKGEPERVRVRIGEQTAGYFTAAMTDRHRARIEDAWASGRQATAIAEVHRGSKGGEQLWRLKIGLAMPADTQVSFVPARLVNVRTRTNHYIGEQLADGGWRTRCGTIIAPEDVQVLCYSRPAGRVVDRDTEVDFDLATTSRCQKC